MSAPAIRKRFAELLDVPAGNGLWARISGVLQWVTLDTDGTLAGNLDTRVASQKATKAYTDAEATTRAAADTSEAAARVAGLATKQADMGVTLDTDGTLAANSDTRVPSQRAVKTAIANSGYLPASISHRERYLCYGITVGGVTTYYARNQYTGQIEYQGASAVSACNTALTAMKSADAYGNIGGVCRAVTQMKVDEANSINVYSGSALVVGEEFVTDQPGYPHQGACLAPTPNQTGSVVKLLYNDAPGIGSTAFPVFYGLISGADTSDVAGGLGQHGVEVSDDNGALLDAIVRGTVFNVGGLGVYANSVAKLSVDIGYLERCAKGAIGGNYNAGNIVRAPAIWAKALYGIGNVSACGNLSLGYAIDGDQFSTLCVSGLRFKTCPGGGLRFLHTTGEAAEALGCRFVECGGPLHPQATFGRSSGTTLVDPSILASAFYDGRVSGSCAVRHIDLDFGNVGQAVAGYVDANTFTTLANGHAAIGGAAGSNKPYSTSTFTIGFNKGYNDKIGKLTSFFDTSNAGLASPHGATISDSSGSTAVPVASGVTIGVQTFSGDYVNIGSAKEISVSGGTGVSITIKDAAGNTIQSGLATLIAYVLRPHWTINFGAFSVAPTVVAVVV